MKGQAFTDLIASIQAAHRIALILHVSPDGDACGSAFALRRALLTCGKDVTAVCDHGVPRIYDDLDGASTLATPAQALGEAFDLAIAVDVADRLRMGQSVAVFDAAAHTAQIDHHHTNPGYAQTNYVVSPLSATAVLIMEVIDALSVPLDEPLAKCLFVAVTTDTGNFKQQNTDPQALQLAARCIQTGLDPSAVTRRVFDVRPLPQVKLLARALESLRVYEKGALIMMMLTKQDFVETGALPEHTEGVVNFGINTEGARIACLLSHGGELVKGSLRSIPPVDVSRVATELGGGGHPAAAGFTMDLPIEDAYIRIQEEMSKELKRH